MSPKRYFCFIDCQFCCYIVACGLESYWKHFNYSCNHHTEKYDDEMQLLYTESCCFGSDVSYDGISFVALQKVSKVLAAKLALTTEKRKRN